MVTFFHSAHLYYGVESITPLSADTLQKLQWLFAVDQQPAQKTESPVEEKEVVFVGPRSSTITPWSTNAVEITRNAGVIGITRIECYQKANPGTSYDPLLQQIYQRLDEKVFAPSATPAPILYIDNIAEYNTAEGLALNEDEIKYLEQLSQKIGRKLTDTEIFGFSQVNSEHCRHKIFNGTFEIDGQTASKSLFQWIKETTKQNKNQVVSAYSDNCAFLTGPVVTQFAPESGDKPSYFQEKPIETVLSLKAETHNFPTTVEPFNGAATGSGGEIRDRLAGGKGSLPLAGTAVYITSYPRIYGNIKKAEEHIAARSWLYQSPEDVLIKASNGASDFGNKFGQPLITGSLLTFEQELDGKIFAFDKVIMLAGGIGYAKSQDTFKEEPQKGDLVIVLGGDNYRIGMGGGAVSSVETGKYTSNIELNAVQRSNPEMQKRVANVIRSFSESANNPIVSIHDHGAGGHLNCLSELLEKTGGEIDITALPIGDASLSAKEIMGNESQERMGLIIKPEALPLLQSIAERERAPMYIVGKITDTHKIKVHNPKTQEVSIDLTIDDLFGNPPKTKITDTQISIEERPFVFNKIASSNFSQIEKFLPEVLKLESVACKDWLTNKVDRSVTGKVATQQCVGELQLPLNNLGVMALEYSVNPSGIATAIGHAPGIAVTKPENSVKIAVTKALTNIVWANLKHGLNGVSLSANWMWACKQKGEDAKLYHAVESLSKFCQELQINVPTGKDSLSMTQKYPDNMTVSIPGTVIISAAAEVESVRKTVTPALQPVSNSGLLYIDFSSTDLQLGGSAYSQVVGTADWVTPTVQNTDHVKRAFEATQKLVAEKRILSGHDISSGGLITTVLEMCFPNKNVGIEVDFSDVLQDSSPLLLFAENPGIVIQVQDIIATQEHYAKHNIKTQIIGKVIEKPIARLFVKGNKLKLDIDYLRDIWMQTSYLLDRKQSGEVHAKMRYENYKNQPLHFKFPHHFDGKLPMVNKNQRPKAAIIREKGTNGEREMAWALHLAGFDVKDVHTTDLSSGKETLEDIRFIVFTGGFANSDVLGSAKGWAGVLNYNETARKAIGNFYQRQDTLSLGVCNGCQLMTYLQVLGNENGIFPYMTHNDSHKLESAFVNVEIPESNSILLQKLTGTRLGIWLAHGEGKFILPKTWNSQQISLYYGYQDYPANPNGSEKSIAGICSADGRHLAMMPHPERSIYPWSSPHYPLIHLNDDVTPWVEMFLAAKVWIK